MGKQQTPLQKAIAWCDKELKDLNKPIGDAGRTRDKSAWDKLVGRHKVLGQMKAYLQSLLPEEKKFAEDVYNQAVDNISEDPEYDKKLRLFTDFYKQYEDE